MDSLIPESRGLLKHARLKAGCFVGTSVFCCQVDQNTPDCLVGQIAWFRCFEKFLLQTGTGAVVGMAVWSQRKMMG